MSASGRVGLIARIRQIRRMNERSAAATRSAAERPDAQALGPLEDRVRQLEQLVYGLQDAVYRESTRQSDRIAELEARIEPGAMGKALSEDARDRGL